MESSYVYSRLGCRYKSIFYSSNNDNSIANRNKNIFMVGNNIWRKNTLLYTNVVFTSIYSTIYIWRIYRSNIGKCGNRSSTT